MTCGGKVRLVQYLRARQEETWPAPILHLTTSISLLMPIREFILEYPRAVSGR
jgi:hypothetical protein